MYANQGNASTGANTSANTTSGSSDGVSDVEYEEVTDNK
jgi:molecular chaperone DnaK